MDDTDEAMATQSDSSSIGEAVSGRGENVPEGEEEDDLYYIPPRRPSLDLGENSMDISNRHYVEQALTPAQSYRSMTSEEDSDEMGDDQECSTGIQLDRADSYSSCYSFDSDDCEKRAPKIKTKDAVSEPAETLELIQDPEAVSHPSLTVGFTLKAICSTFKEMSVEEFWRFKRMLWKYYPQLFTTSFQSMDMLDLGDRLLECYSLQLALQITKTILVKIGQKTMVDFLQTLCIRNEVQYDLKEALKKKYSEVCLDLAMEGEKRPLDEVFTNLYISSNPNNGPNIEHEAVTIKRLDTNQGPGNLISSKDIFTAESLENQPHIKIILVTGVAGSGKSMMVRRLALDWAEERSHQHIAFVFPLSFRELKQFEGSKVSLQDIIQQIYPETKKLRTEDYRSSECKMLFVFDGLDEYTGKVDFENTELLCDYADPTTLKVIVVNVMRGRLLYSNLSVVTTRPQVHSCIPWDTFHQQIEVRGFCDPDKDEYFKKRFKDPNQATQVIAYVNSIKSLRIMCHLPLFCSLVADECQRIFQQRGTQVELPRSITYMYTKLMLVLIRQLRTVRASKWSPDEELEFLMKLGKQALNMLEKDQFRVTMWDWKELQISEREAVVNSGLCTQYLVKPHVLFHEKVLSFIHPTMQEYLAALYVFLLFRIEGKNVFDQKGKFMGVFKGSKSKELYKCALDMSLPCEDGRWDFFLRFLFGMAQKSNFELLQPFHPSSLKWSPVEDAAAVINKKIKDKQYPNKVSNLQQCLVELGV
ncbi:protein NLRC3 [Mugil cephalus]|uniref:protein NLRC3 n=1 Tax=Mugil cephalus TaxID=48193 RepID=UPI001FB77634|nr:protein NLRC3 [Mugil cephalus]XP_047463965.1 protein NLRC3 [Mugil cephalus]